MCGCGVGLDVWAEKMLERISIISASRVLQAGSSGWGDKLEEPLNRNHLVRRLSGEV